MTEPLADPPPISADLSSLFAPTGPGVRFGQGLITAWNPLTGENTIEWSGGTLTDVPILNTGEAVALRPGRVVGMLGQGLTWFIIGRVTPPNDPDFASASLAFAALNNQATNFALSTSLATKVSVSLNVPPWADEAAVYVTGACSLVNSGAADFASCSVFIDGNPGTGVQTGFASGPTNVTNQHLQTMAVSSARLHTPTASTILCELKIYSNLGWTAQSANIAEISAMAVYRSIT